MSLRSLGLDTSNYTTSAAVFDRAGAVRNCGKLLEVPDGALGLRQSDAVFQHVKRLPQMVEALREEGLLEHLAVVGASTRPRALEDSYMPCFLVGKGQGETLAAVLGVPFFACSHQQGHLAAAAWSAGREDLLDEPHLAWHLSGGTTELLLVEPEGSQVRAQCIGGSSDISAGQLVDRTGQALVLAFPAGRALDELAQTSNQDACFSVKQKDLIFSLSGMENKMRQNLASGMKTADCARFVLETLADILLRTTQAARKRYGDLPVLCSGGVASNSLLRMRLRETGALFAPPEYSTDNALGVAILALRALNKGELG